MSDTMRFVLDLVTIGLTISLVFVIIRLVRGPSLPNSWKTLTIVQHIR
jgi:multisubunit Na+/H+ antiporter MnhF subunit